LAKKQPLWVFRVGFVGRPKPNVLFVRLVFSAWHTTVLGMSVVSLRALRIGFVVLWLFIYLPSPF